MAHTTWTLTPDQWSLVLALARMGVLTKAQLQQLCLPGRSASTFERAMKALQRHTPPLVTTHERAFDNAAAYSLTDAAREGIGQHPPAPSAFCIDSAPLRLAKLHHRSLWKHDHLANSALIALISWARETGLSGVGIRYEVQLDPKRTKPRADAILRIERHEQACAPDVVPWLSPERRVGTSGWVFALEADTGSERIEQVAQKADDYRYCWTMRGWQSEWWGRYSDVPIVLLVTSSPARLERINREWHARWPEGCWLLTTEAQLRENHWVAHLSASHFACRLFHDRNAGNWYTTLHDVAEPEPPPLPQTQASVAQQAPTSYSAASTTAPAAASAPTISTTARASYGVVPTPKAMRRRDLVRRWFTLLLEEVGYVVWWTAWRAGGRVLLRLYRWQQQLVARQTWGSLAPLVLGASLPYIALSMGAVLLVGLLLRNLGLTFLAVLHYAHVWDRPALAVLARLLLVLLVALHVTFGWRITRAYVPVVCWRTNEAATVLLHSIPSLRQQPNSEIHYITPGQPLRCYQERTVLAEGWRWRQVRAGSLWGWVLDDQVSLTPIVAAEPLPTPQAVAPTPAPCWQLRLRPKVADVYSIERPVEHLNIRAEPGLSAAIIATINRDATLTDTGASVEADGVTWLPVQLADGQQGWASATYPEAACTFLH